MAHRQSRSFDPKNQETLPALSQRFLGGPCNRLGRWRDRRRWPTFRFRFRSRVLQGIAARALGSRGWRAQPGTRRLRKLRKSIRKNFLCIEYVIEQNEHQTRHGGTENESEQHLGHGKFSRLTIAPSQPQRVRLPNFAAGRTPTAV